jgi:hypothetical protein
MRGTEIETLLRDQGQRYWRRFAPTPELPAKVTLIVEGVRLRGRAVHDISLGGLAIGLRFYDKRRIAILQPVHLELVVADDVPIRLQGRVHHLQTRQSFLTESVTAGLRFDENLAYLHGRTAIARYLLKLARLEVGLRKAS